MLPHGPAYIGITGHRKGQEIKNASVFASGSGPALNNIVACLGVDALPRRLLILALWHWKTSCENTFVLAGAR
jgi:hypothetical protein